MHATPWSVGPLDHVSYVSEQHSIAYRQRTSEFLGTISSVERHANLWFTPQSPNSGDAALPCRSGIVMDWQLRCIFGADTMKINRTILNSSMYWGAIAHLWASHCMQCSLWAPYSLEELGTSSSRRNMLRTVLVCTNNTQCRPAAQKHCALRVSIATTIDGQSRPSI